MAAARGRQRESHTLELAKIHCQLSVFPSEFHSMGFPNRFPSISPFRSTYSPQSHWTAPKCCRRGRRCTPWSRTARPGVGCPHNLASSWCFVCRGCGLSWTDIYGSGYGSLLLYRTASRTFVSGVTRNWQGDKEKPQHRRFFLGVTYFQLQREVEKERERERWINIYQIVSYFIMRQWVLHPPLTNYRVSAELCYAHLCIYI